MVDEEGYKTLTTGRITTRATVGTPDYVHKAEHARNVMQGYTVGSLRPDRADVFNIDYSPEKLKMGGGEEPEVTRGIRNNNPFNLVYTDDAWEGKLGRDLEVEDTFERFDSPEAGIRAGAINVLTQFSRGDNTIAKLLKTLSPPGKENPNYEKHKEYVAGKMNRTQDEVLDLTDPMTLRGLATALIGFENANHAYEDELLDGALARALEFHLSKQNKNLGGPVTQPFYNDKKYII